MSFAVPNNAPYRARPIGRIILGSKGHELISATSSKRYLGPVKLEQAKMKIFAHSK